jgi:hypothetical protein
MLKAANETLNNIHEFQLKKYNQLVQGSGCFFYDKMPGCCLPSRTAATALQFTAGYLQLTLKQGPTLCFAFLGGNSPLPVRSTEAIILS